MFLRALEARERAHSRARVRSRIVKVSENSRGVMYVAWGKEHVDVARRSAMSVQRTNPGLQTAIWCHAGDDATGFDHAFVIPPGLARPKVDLLNETPFSETLYLDNDTLIRADLTGLYDLLARFDLCGAHVSLWHRPRHNQVWRKAPPEAFPEINCGVLLYRRSAAVQTFFQAWSDAFIAAGLEVDQVTFRELLWESDLRFYVFPPQYNKRVFEASELIWSDLPRAKIFHLELLRPTRNPFISWLANRVR